MGDNARYQVFFQPGDDPIQFGGDDLQNCEAARKFEVNVFYTSELGTQKAMEWATVLARGLAGHVRLVFICSVHRALPLDEPAVSLPFIRDKLTSIAKVFPGDALIHIFLCRDSARALRQVFPHPSLVVLGGKKRWWLTKEQRLEKKLEKVGHQVIFVGAR